MTRKLTRLCLLFDIIASFTKKRSPTPLLLLSVAITSTLRMNYKSEANRDLLLTRLPVLTIRDVQYR